MSYENVEKKELAVRVSEISKNYEIYESPLDRLKEFIFPRFLSFFGFKQEKYYKDFWALKNISFDIKKGKTFGIVGKNGSGKSTLLQIICGTLHPNQGIVETHGKVAALLELGSGFNPEFSGRENVYFNASILGQSEEETKRKFSAIENFADIGDFIDQPVKTYSSGMMVRLAFAVIAHVDAEILVIDEALSVGDAFFTQKCMRYLRQFMKNGTVIFVSHDLGAVKNLCDEVVWIDQGILKYQGDAKTACDLYIEELFSNDGSLKKLEEQRDEKIIVCERDNDKISKNNINYKMEPDFRLQLLNKTNLRNDIVVYEFEDDLTSFSSGVGRINKVFLYNQDNRIINYISGGEIVVLEISVTVNKDVSSPIIGFYIKDRLGQCLFGDNTWLNYSENTITVLNGQSLIAKFTFRMPMLHVGDYSVTASFAEGTQENFKQHHWIHDAILFTSQTTSVAGGLIGIPMHNIELMVGGE